MKTLDTKEIIKIISSEYGWNMEEISRITGVSRPTAYNWRDGKSKMTIENYYAIINAASNKESDLSVLMDVKSVYDNGPGKPGGDIFFSCTDKECQKVIDALKTENERLKSKIIELQDKLLNQKHEK